jgi:hypothetical protein
MLYTTDGKFINNNSNIDIYLEDIYSNKNTNSSVDSQPIINSNNVKTEKKNNICNDGNNNCNNYTYNLTGSYYSENIFKPTDFFVKPENLK